VEDFKIFDNNHEDFTSLILSIEISTTSITHFLKKRNKATSGTNVWKMKNTTKTILEGIRFFQGIDLLNEYKNALEVYLNLMLSINLAETDSGEGNWKKLKVWLKDNSFGTEYVFFVCENVEFWFNAMMLHLQYTIVETVVSDNMDITRNSFNDVLEHFQDRLDHSESNMRNLAVILKKEKDDIVNIVVDQVDKLKENNDRYIAVLKEREYHCKEREKQCKERENLNKEREVLNKEREEQFREREDQNKEKESQNKEREDQFKEREDQFKEREDQCEKRDEIMISQLDIFGYMMKKYDAQKDHYE
jgi:hypothetical protein